MDGKKKGDIDYMAFLLRFRPVNALLDNKRLKALDGEARPVSENVEAILEMLHKNRYELESLFRHFGQTHINRQGQHNKHEPGRVRRQTSSFIARTVS